MLLNATYQVTQSGMPREVEFTSGFSVATKSILKAAPYIAERLTFATIVEAAQHAQYGEYVGVWTDPETGYLYIDLSAVYDDLDNAKRAAKAMNELAVFDWSTKEDIRL